ncbi:predicted protein [Plenodomus lingam JN3]|uniref:Predicted protein n=1 Tax=Leptosphaeria maculans (strain JN3 / isolate v23.1.3 / race Av1-4-5-6-7-8) TaxID=985895 RepID=E4ZUR5_LEPMJ|nr:predicted protein [Plenodomus lingam JN3]CBX95144.1 predicted protein [Plenodomus lingam JN3]
MAAQDPGKQRGINAVSAYWLLDEGQARAGVDLANIGHDNEGFGDWVEVNGGPWGCGLREPDVWRQRPAPISSHPTAHFLGHEQCHSHPNNTYAHNDPSSLHPDGSTPETLCKIDAVQLVWLQVTMDTALVVCGIFLAERWGAQFILLCDLVSRVFVSAWALVVGECDYGVDRTGKRGPRASFFGRTLHPLTANADDTHWPLFEGVGWGVRVSIYGVYPDYSDHVLSRLCGCFQIQKTSFASFAPIEIPVSSEDVEPLLGNRSNSPAPVAKRLCIAVEHIPKHYRCLRMRCVKPATNTVNRIMAGYILSAKALVNFDLLAIAIL